MLVTFETYKTYLYIPKCHCEGFTESPAPVVPSPGTQHAPRRTWGPQATCRHMEVISHGKLPNGHEMIITLRQSSGMVSAHLIHLMLLQSFPFSRDASTPTFPFEAPAFFASAPCSSAASALWQTSASSVAQWPSHCRTKNRCFWNQRIQIS